MVQSKVDGAFAIGVFKKNFRGFKKMKKMLFPSACVAYTLYWVGIMTRFNLGTMESYIIWTVLWLNFGVLSGSVFNRGHEMAVEHLREEGIRYNNKYRYLSACVCAVMGIIGYYAAFKYFDSQDNPWGAVAPAAYLILMEVVSRFVWAGKLSRVRRRKRHNIRRG